MNKLTRDLKVQDVTSTDNKLVFSFASSTPYLRENKKYGEYLEVLEISDEAIDFVRLVDNKAPLLLNHDTDKQIGVVVRAWIEDGKLYCEVKFSDSDEAQQIMRDVLASIRRNTSIGYNVDDYQMITSQPGQPPTMLVKKWTPVEVSIVRNTCRCKCWI